MKKITLRSLAAGSLAVVLAASAASAQDTTPITYVDATHGSGGNTTLLDGNDWDPEPANTADNDGGVWVIRTRDTPPGFGNGDDRLVYQSPFASDGHRLVTSVSGLPEETYNVFVYFWSDESPWRIRASLTEEAELPLFIRGDEGVVQFYAGANPPDDAPVLSSGLDGGNPFTTAVIVGEQNRRLHQAHVGTFTGTEFSVFIDDGPAGQQQNRTWYDGIGYAVVGDPPATEFPLAADFGSVRFVNIRDDLGAGDLEIGVAEEGALPFIDEEISITSLPSQLEGKVALRTANTHGTWLFDQEPVTIEWTYTDAVPDLDIDGSPREGANTTLADGSGAFGPPLGNFEAADEWVVREGTTEGNRFGNVDDRVFQAYGPADSGGPLNAPELRTTIRDLEPGKVYPVTAMFWHDQSPWGLRAGLEYGNDMHENELFVPDHPAALDTRTFAWTNEGILTAQNNRLMKAAFLGHIAANDDGEIDVFVHDRPTDDQAERTWYDGVAVGSEVFKESGTYLAFEVDRDTTMYVINDPASEPVWLTSSFSLTGMTVDTTAGTFDVWQRAVAARELVVLPGKGGEFADMNYWVVLDEGPDAITERPDSLFQSLPSSDWSVGDYFQEASSSADAELHTASMMAQVSNFSPESGFRLTSTVRVPRLQEDGDNSIGFLLLGGTDEAIRAEWLPRASGGASVLRFVDTSDGSTLAQQSWTGLVPTATDNGVGASGGAVESLYSAGAPVFVEDAETVVFAEDFEAGGTGWTHGSEDYDDGTQTLPATDQWEIGVPTSGPGSAFTGTNVAATILDGAYVTGDAGDETGVVFVAWLRSPVIDLSDAVSATLRFQEFMALDPFQDELSLYHHGTVKALDADSLEELEELAVYKEEIGAWSERVLDLSGVAGGQIILEFALVTDEFNESLPDGWYIDAVEVTAKGIEIETMPEKLALDGTLFGIATERAGVDDASENYLQFTVSDLGVSGNDGVTVYVAWDIRASGLEPDWLTQDFDRTDHFVGVSGDGGFHRLWAREYADGAQVTLGGASAAGPGAAGLPFGTRNYFVLLGDARPGLETFYTLEATGEWTGDAETLTFTLTDSNGASESVQTTVSGVSVDRNQFGVAVHHSDTGTPTWEVFSLAMDVLDAPDLLTFDQWRNSMFTTDQVNAGLADPDAAPAGDGVANIIKYALDLAPLEPANTADLPRLEPGQNDPLILVYRERTDIDRNEIEYRPEVSDDLLGDWESGSLSIEELNRQSMGPNLEEVTVRGNLPAEAAKGFIRLNVIQHN